LSTTVAPGALVCTDLMPFSAAKSRMASTYVDRARQAGCLPPTKQGKKKA
jgi:hypothetical protein